jgi:hypothetical protein
MVMSVNSKMTAIADEIRELSGTTGTMGLDAMATNVAEANGLVDSEAELIARIATALEGKAAGGGGSSGNFEAVTVSIVNDRGAVWVDYISPDGYVSKSLENGTVDIQCVNPSFIVFEGGYNVAVVEGTAGPCIPGRVYIMLSACTIHIY